MRASAFFFLELFCFSMLTSLGTLILGSFFLFGIINDLIDKYYALIITDNIHFGKPDGRLRQFSVFSFLAAFMLLY